MINVASQISKVQEKVEENCCLQTIQQNYLLDYNSVCQCGVHSLLQVKEVQKHIPVARQFGDDLLNL